MKRPKPPKGVEGARCHKCKQDKLVRKHHDKGIYQIVCPACGFEASKPESR